MKQRKNILLSSLILLLACLSSDASATKITLKFISEQEGDYRIISGNSLEIAVNGRPSRNFSLLHINNYQHEFEMNDSGPADIYISGTGARVYRVYNGKYYCKRDKIYF